MGRKTLRETYRMLIEAVYSKWNSDKIGDIPRLMEKYVDQEAEIYDRIARKYVFCRAQKDWQPLIEAMYARFNPSKLTELEGIFLKYKESEAALYRALCDKYLPTLEENDPFVFHVWGAPEPITVSPSHESEDTSRDGPDSEPLQEKALEAPESPDGIGENLSAQTELQRRALRPKAAPKPALQAQVMSRPLSLEPQESQELARPEECPPQAIERRRKRRKVKQHLPVQEAACEAFNAQSELEERKQQLKQKLFELKMQISTEAQAKQNSRSFWGPGAIASSQHDGSASDSEDSQKGGSARNVVLRNQLEAQLRAKLTKP